MYSLIVVDYNSLEKTIEYIQLCWKFLGEKGAAHVVIVENGTPSNPLELLADNFGETELLRSLEIEQPVYSFEKGNQQVLYCNSGANLGYAKGNNLGVIIASKIWSDPFYIISNNDLVFSKTLDLSVVDHIFDEKPEVGIVGPMVVTPAGEQQSPRILQSAPRRLIVNYWISACGNLLGSNTGRKLWDKYCNDTVQNAQNGFFDWVTGCFFFVRADAFHRAGMFDNYTFLYAEEMIIAKRLESVGSRVYFCRDVEVIHKHAESTKKALTTFRMAEVDFDANCYFYSRYMGVSKTKITCAKISFALYRVLFHTKQKIKHCLRKQN